MFKFPLCGETENRNVVEALGHNMAFVSANLDGKRFECSSCDHFEAIPFDSFSVTPSSTNLQNNTTVTITGYYDDGSIILASRSVKLEQRGTQTVKIGT